MSLRSKQIATLERMLHLNKDGAADLTAPASEEILWKALILDRKSRLVLSLVLRVNDLLRCGITVHALIDSKRSPLPDVPAIYFVEPTSANVLQIIDDVAADYYELAYVNFTLPINRELLEEFAKKVSIAGCAHKIKQVYDQYLDFVVTEPNLFSLDMPRVFARINSPAADEDAIHALVSNIAAGLLSTVATTGEVPIVRAPPGGPAEYVASELDRRLREYASNSRTSVSATRPALIILDRSIDLASMFSHSWIYQCMVGDVFDLLRNTITIRKLGTNGEKTTKTYDVDPKDFFWAKYSQLPFPDVVEHADSELNTYKKDAQDLTARTGITLLNDIDTLQSDTLHIQQAVDALPELTARKATLDMHMDILAALITELQARGLDRFFEIEQSAASPKMQQEFLELVESAGSSGEATVDMLRTFLILVLLTDLPRDYVSRIEAIFRDRYGHDMRALRYVLKCKEVAKLTNIALLTDTSSSAAAPGTADALALLSGLSSKLYGLTEGRISEGLSSIASKVKSFIPEKKLLPITNVVEAITDPQKASAASLLLTDEYIYFDPKLRGGHTGPPRRQTYSEASVFVIGGGSYLEYQNLQEWASVAGKNVVYGATDVVSPVQFLDECAELGE